MNKKKSGSYYTPESLIIFMMSQLHNTKYRNVLEPSAGDGRFAPYLKNFSDNITFVEKDGRKVKKIQDDNQQIVVLHDDFIKYAFGSNEKYDLIIGNPPYIRKNTISKSNLVIYTKFLSDCNLSSAIFQNIWVMFILGAIRLLDESGTIFFVLPFDFLQVQYAEVLRNILEEKFNIIEISTFEGNVFPETEQDICLVYLTNKKNNEPYIRYTTYTYENHFQKKFQSYIIRNKPLKKWSNCILNDQETERIKKISRQYTLLCDLGEISPGIVTGKNSFFIISNKQKKYLNLGKVTILPIIMNSSQIPFLLSFNKSDFDNLSNKNISNYLLNFNDTDKTEFTEEIKEYIHEAEEKKINKGFKCVHRDRWYDVPIIKRGQVCFMRRYSTIPKLFVNTYNVYTTDSSYNIRCKREYDAKNVAFCFYNSLTLTLCEYYGRFYGGGVSELMPREFKKLVIPYKEIDIQEFEELDRKLRNNESIVEIIDYVDKIVLSDMDESDISFLQDIRTRYINRRLKIYG